MNKTYLILIVLNIQIFACDIPDKMTMHIALQNEEKFCREILQNISKAGLPQELCVEVALYLNLKLLGNVDNLDQKIKAHKNPVRSISVSPCGKYFATVSDDQTAKIWEINDLRKPPILLQASGDRLASVKYSPCGRYIVIVGLRSDPKVFDIDNIERDPIILDDCYGCGKRVIDFSPCGKRLIIAGRLGMRIFNVSDFTKYEPVVSVIYFAKYNINSAKYSPCGKFILISTVNYDPYSYAIKILDANNVSEIAEIRHHNAKHEIYEAIYSPCGEFIASCAFDSTTQISKVADTSDTKANIKLEALINVRKQFLSPLLPESDGEDLAKLVLTSSSDPCVIKFSPLGNYIAVGDSKGLIEIYNLNDATEWSIILEENDGSFVSSLEFNISGNYLISGSSHGCIKLGNLKSYLFDNITLQQKAFLSRLEVRKDLGFHAEGLLFDEFWMNVFYSFNSDQRQSIKQYFKFTLPVCPICMEEYNTDFNITVAPFNCEKKKHYICSSCFEVMRKCSIEDQVFCPQCRAGINYATFIVDLQYR